MRVTLVDSVLRQAGYGYAASLWRGRLLAVPLFDRQGGEHVSAVGGMFAFGASQSVWEGNPVVSGGGDARQLFDAYEPLMCDACLGRVSCPGALRHSLGWCGGSSTA
jgi:hypothetical protein